MPKYVMSYDIITPGIIEVEADTRLSYLAHYANNESRSIVNGSVFVESGE